MPARPRGRAPEVGEDWGPGVMDGVRVGHGERQESQDTGEGGRVFYSQAGSRRSDSEKGLSQQQVGQGTGLGEFFSNNEMLPGRGGGGGFQIGCAWLAKKLHHFQSHLLTVQR